MWCVRGRASALPSPLCIPIAPWMARWNIDEREQNKEGQRAACFLACCPVRSLQSRMRRRKGGENEATQAARGSEREKWREEMRGGITALLRRNRISQSGPLLLRKNSSSYVHLTDICVCVSLYFFCHCRSQITLVFSINNISKTV